jgi:D-alanine-D-alanine ligase
MKKIGIICGGYSSEYEISIKSAKTILTNFPDGFESFLIIVDKNQWVAHYRNEEITFDPWNLSFTFQQNEIVIDAGIIYIHGNPGENGKIQALFEMKGIPCINSGSLASALSFDKWYCNQFLKSFNIPIAKSILLTNKNQIKEEEIIKELGLPCFVKPSDSGSSYGISKVNSSEELNPALKNAFKEGKTVVIESFLKGTEVTCAAYNTQNGIETLPITEIVSENDFFDFDAKYNGKSEEIIPARITEEEKFKVEELTKKIYLLLNLKSVVRIDYMLVNNEPYVIEVNTTPGFSSASIVPRMLKHKQKSIKDFWKDILDFELNA